MEKNAKKSRDTATLNTKQNLWQGLYSLYLSPYTNKIISNIIRVRARCITIKRLVREITKLLEKQFE